MTKECARVGCTNNDTMEYLINGSSSMAKGYISICKDHVDEAREEGMI